VKFSIGFGPTLWKHKPKGSPTVYQIAIIPFLAYVQIAGMNPYEEQDPNDKGSYANASLWGRIVTIAAGPLANYLFASVLMFFGFWIGGEVIADTTSMHIAVDEEGPAYAAGIRKGDRIVSVNGEATPNWDVLKKAISGHPGQQIDIETERNGTLVHVPVVPKAGGENNGKILIGPDYRIRPIGPGEAFVLSLEAPPKVVAELARGIVRVVTLKEKPDLAGPVGIVREGSRAAKRGTGDWFMFLGTLSAYLGGFNLLPFPALDGGRLIFLLYEAVSRRRADAKVEAKVHAIGLLMMLTLIAFVTYTELVPKR
jgi:regulator of sigma E protease